MTHNYCIFCRVATTATELAGMSVRFSHNLFKNLNFIGQVDKKFIAVSAEQHEGAVSCRPLFILFDQHAVHERIRLEDLLKGEYTVVTHRLGRCFVDMDTHFSH